jgi:hypothetical protein
MDERAATVDGRAATVDDHVATLDISGATVDEHVAPGRHKRCDGPRGAGVECALISLRLTRCRRSRRLDGHNGNSHR